MKCVLQLGCGRARAQSRRSLLIAFWIFSIVLPVLLLFPERFLQVESFLFGGLMLQGFLQGPFDFGRARGKLWIHTSS